MVGHCDSGCCATWFATWFATWLAGWEFAGWEKALVSAEAIPTTQEMPISHLASFITIPHLAGFLPSRGFIVDYDAGKQGSNRDTLFLIRAHCKERAGPGNLHGAISGISA